MRIPLHHAAPPELVDLLARETDFARYGIGRRSSEICDRLRAAALSFS